MPCSMAIGRELLSESNPGNPPDLTPLQPSSNAPNPLKDQSVCFVLFFKYVFTHTGLFTYTNSVLNLTY